MSMTRYLFLPQDFGRTQRTHDLRRIEAVTNDGKTEFGF